MYFDFDKESSEKLFVIKPRRNKSISSFTLRLTSMIDMFTILLVFLLQSFSAEGEIMSVAQDLRLPESSAETPPRWNHPPQGVSHANWVNFVTVGFNEQSDAYALMFDPGANVRPIHPVLPEQEFRHPSDRRRTVHV